MAATGRGAAVPENTAAVRVLASDDARRLIRERGSALYVWTSVHGQCEGRVTLLEADTDCPSSGEHHFERINAGDLHIFLDMGSRRRPEILELVLRGRQKRITAYWNGEASVR